MYYFYLDLKCGCIAEIEVGGVSDIENRTPVT